MRFGILQRYVMGEVFRSFFMALLTITIIFVLFIVMAKATELGLSPREILAWSPFVIPGSLPYTVPVSLLFAVTVVYGRLAGDNEVIADQDGRPQRLDRPPAGPVARAAREHGAARSPRRRPRSPGPTSAMQRALFKGL